jgi:uncharacterized protein YjbI with pentapeptide repeats
MASTKDLEQQEIELERQPGDLSRQPKSFVGNRAHLRRFIDSLQEPRVESWNAWRKKHPKLRPDLRGLDLTVGDVDKINIGGIDLGWARLSGARLSGLRSWNVNLTDADLSHANLDLADLSLSYLKRANLNSCRLIRTNLTGVEAQGANFRNANLSHAVMNGVHLEGADLRGAKVVGVSTWEVQVDSETKQDGLILEELGDFIEDLIDDTDKGYKQRVVGRVCNIEAVQLLYLIRDKYKLKTVIDALTANLVLILGNFSSRRLKILRAVEEKLADLGYAPVVFDFESPDDRDLIETVALLAGLSSFLIVDLTEPRSTPLETMLIAPQLGVPLASIIQKGARPFSMFSALQAKYWWVLPTWTYRDEKHLVRQLPAAIIDPCEKTRARLRRRRSAALRSLEKQKQV